ncbi:MAG: DUF2288 domain-containing protein [Gammaproteobacteria bacterium HGW-Gammaproteobacteria-1]|jgi:hypothetical protein|nr:MAG: DUF2288 domain-containing protein [Gammaproteobacteria bacterium HGW-Gammaproteobacteria-1]
MSEQEQELRAKLNSETAQIGWPELERHFARGVVVAVAPGMDLIDVAHAMARDDSAALAAWMQAGQVTRADAEQARDWHARQAVFWAVVVAPWVVIQEVQPRLDS